jgi:hypothetical protein
MCSDRRSHELPDHLRRRPLLSAARFEKLIPELAFKVDAQARVFRCHNISVTNGSHVGSRQKFRKT